MKSKERKENVLGKGMELIRDGIELTGKIKAARRCICSPGGWNAGNVDCGCACGCIYWPDQQGSSPRDNNVANFNIANPEL